MLMSLLLISLCTDDLLTSRTPVQTIASPCTCRAGGTSKYAYALMQDAEQKWAMVLSPWNMLDFFAFFPPLLELWVNHSIRISFSLGHFDFRWFKILR